MNTASEDIRVGLVDDKAINRHSIGEKLKQLPGVQYCFTAINGDDCLEQLKGLPLGKYPQVVFMDIEMPGMDGIQAVSLAKPIYPGIHFIMLTIYDDDDKIFEAIKAGAGGYLLKDESADGLLAAIQNAVVHGGAPMSAAIARRTLELLSKATLPKAQAPARTEILDEVLTDREKEILQLTVQGYDAKKIAEVTAISVLTVRKHIANIYRKLHVSSKSQAMRISYQRGLL